MSIAYDSKIVVSRSEHLRGRLVCYSAAKIDGPFGLPTASIMPSLVTPALNIRDLLKWLLCVCFLFFLCSDDRAMGFPDSSCLFFDLIPFVYLLS